MWEVFMWDSDFIRFVEELRLFCWRHMLKESVLCVFMWGWGPYLVYCCLGLDEDVINVR